MILLSDVNPESLKEHGALALADTTLEVIVVLHSTDGLAGVEALLLQPDAGFTREGLRRDADVLAAIGLKPLASLLRRYARNAKPEPPTFATRYARRSLKPL